VSSVVAENPAQNPFEGNSLTNAWLLFLLMGAGKKGRPIGRRPEHRAERRAARNC
jgi:hypothetical protein